MSSGAQLIDTPWRDKDWCRPHVIDDSKIIHFQAGKEGRITLDVSKFHSHRFYLNIGCYTKLFYFFHVIYANIRLYLTYI